MSIYEHNSSFDQSLGTKKFVIGCVVDNVQDTDFTVAGLGSPGEVTGFETEGAELEVSSAGSDGGDVFGSDLGHGCWTTVVELALLGEFTTASSCLATLISSGTSDSLLRLD
jgi:hypothetical protein